jgi:RND family efflux transporter MFP subunit
MSGQGAPKKRRRWIWWAVLGAVVVAAVAIAYPMLSGSQDLSSQYTTAQVTKTDLRVTVSGSGNAIVGSAVSVDPGISGTVYDLSVKLGDTVAAGQLLFRLENDDLDAAVERAKTSYNQAKSGVIKAEIDLAKSKQALYDLQHPTDPAKTPTATDLKVAKLNVSNATLGYTSSKQDRANAYTSLQSAEDDADKRTVKAPVSGLLTVLNAQNGQALGSSSGSSSGGGGTGTSSSAAAEISDMSTLRASILVNEVDLVKVALGATSTVIFDSLPDATTTGTVSAISPTGANNSGVVTYNVDITLLTIDPRLRPGMSCSADILVSEIKDALVVPSAAVKSANGKQTVQVFDIGGTAPRTVNVTIGAVVGTQTRVLSGLKEGEYVVTGSASSTGGSSSGGGMGGIGAMMGGGRPGGRD